MFQKDGCCVGHYCHYFTFGYNEAMMTPKEYYNRLTDYSEEGKQLNYILAYYSILCDVNIILEIGFGSGDLQRVDHFNGEYIQRVGTPYILKVGYHWTPEIPYDNPGDFVSFPWFKRNLMCLSRPWICGGKYPLKFKHTRWWWQSYFGKRPNFKNKTNLSNS